ILDVPIRASAPPFMNPRRRPPRLAASRPQISQPQSLWSAVFHPLLVMSLLLSRIPTLRSPDHVPTPTITYQPSGLFFLKLHLNNEVASPSMLRRSYPGPLTVSGTPANPAAGPPSPPPRGRPESHSAPLRTLPGLLPSAPAPECRQFRLRRPGTP